MDNTHLLQDRKYKHNKNEQKHPLQNLSNFKVRRGSGEPNKSPRNNIKEINGLLKTKTNVKVNSIESDRGDSIDKTGQEHKANGKHVSCMTRTSKVSIKSEETGNIDSKSRKTNVNCSPEVTYNKVMTKINKIVRENIDLQNNTNMIGSKYANRTPTKFFRVITEAHEPKDVTKRKLFESQLYKKEKENTSKSSTPNKDVDSKTKCAPPVEADKTKTVSLVVKLPKSVSKISKDSKHDDSVAYSNVPSISSKMKNPENVSHCKRTDKELNISSNFGPGKACNKLQSCYMRHDAKPVPNDKQKNILINFGNKKIKMPKLVKDLSKKKKVLTNPIRNGKFVSKQNSNMEHRKRYNKGPLSESPDRNVRIASPPTEVAKWAPNSIDKHTRLYYEAWVSTTLTAVSKGKCNLPLDKTNRMKEFQKYLEQRVNSPVLMYKDFKDRRFVGTIKINHKKT